MPWCKIGDRYCTIAGKRVYDVWRAAADRWLGRVIEFLDDGTMTAELVCCDAATIESACAACEAWHLTSAVHRCSV